MDDITFYFNTNRKYSKDIIGGLEFETCVKDNEGEIFKKVNKRWVYNDANPLKLDYSRLGPYKPTVDTSIKCDKGLMEVEFVTYEPYPIVDIMDKTTVVGKATRYILFDLANRCNKNNSGRVSCGTHVHMSGPWSKKKYPYFDKCMRYLWIQYFQPYFVTKFYAHQDRYNNTYSKLSTHKKIKKYEMFNTDTTKKSDTLWHFEFRGYGEMIGRWETTGHQYLKMLMNLWEATVKLHDKLKLQTMDFVGIERQQGYLDDNKINSDKVWTKLLEVRKLMQLASPNYVGTGIRRRINLLTQINTRNNKVIPNKKEAVYKFNMYAEGLDDAIDYSMYRLRFGKKAEHTFNTPIPDPLDLATGAFYKFHITWHPDLQPLMKTLSYRNHVIFDKLYDEFEFLDAIEIQHGTFRDNSYIIKIIGYEQTVGNWSISKFIYKKVGAIVINGISQILNDIYSDSGGKGVYDKIEKTLLEFAGVPNMNWLNPRLFGPIARRKKYDLHNFRIHIDYVGYYYTLNNIDEEPYDVGEKKLKF